MHPDLDLTYHMGLLGCFSHSIASLREIPVGNRRVWSGRREPRPLCLSQGRMCTWVQLDRHSLGDLTVESFQLGVKGSHQLKYLLLGKECKGESGKQDGLER